MTTQVVDQVSRAQYKATASQTIFPYGFLIFADADITVEQNGSEISTYTVTGAGGTAGGNVILTTGATVGDIITVYRSQGFDRETDYQASGDFLAETVNDDFNRIILMMQQNRESISRSLQYSIDDIVGTTVLPLLGSRANNLLGFDSSGNPTAIPSGTAVTTGNTTDYELGSTAALAAHAGIITGHIIRTNYLTSARVAGSGSEVRYTGTTTSGNAGLWPHTDGYFYDADGKQFKNIGANDIKKFGAVPGATDSIVAMQSAANATGEYETFLGSSGAFTVSDDIDFIADHVQVYGVSCKITQTGSNKRTIHLEEVFDVEVCGFELVGLGTEPLNASTTYNNVAGIYIGNSVNVRVHHNYVNNHAGGSIRFSTPSTGTVCQDINIYRNTVRGMGAAVINYEDINFDAGIAGVDSKNYIDITIDDNDISDHIIGAGISTGTAATPVGGSCKITNNFIHDIPGQHGIYCNPVSSADISGNFVKNCVLDGIKVQIRDNVIFNSTSQTGLSVKGNTIIKCGSNNINVIGNAASSRFFDKTCSITGNTISGGTAAGGKGINADAFKGDISNNTISDIKGYGIRANYCSGSIRDNTIVDVDYNGMDLLIHNGESMFVEGNLIIDAIQNSGALTGSDTRVRYYIYAQPSSGSSEIFISGNTFRSEAAESADFDNVFRTLSNLSVNIVNNDNYTSKMMDTLVAPSFLTFGTEEVGHFTRSGAGTLAIYKPVAHIATGAADALTLLDGAAGQRMSVIMTVDNGNGTVTPSNLAAGTTITFSAVGQNAELLFTNGEWNMLSGTAALA